MTDFDKLPIDDDRPRHPYVAAHPAPDLSARQRTLLSEDIVTVEQRGWESRTIYHTIEGLLGPLTPAGLISLAVACLHRLNPSTLAKNPMAELDGITVEDLDPFGELRAFEEVAGHELRAALEHAERAASICPGCGRTHEDVGWVHTATGEAVQVTAMTEHHVEFRVELPGGRWTEPERWPRVRFEQDYVRADTVRLLG